MGLLEAVAVGLGRRVEVRGIERVLRALYPCTFNTRRFVHGVRRRADGLLMELDSRNWVDWNLLFLGDYEPHLSRLWHRLAPTGGLAIDVGANIGAHTLSMARAVGATGRVLAFEPNPLVRSALICNVDLNHLDQITVFPCALGSQSGTLPLRVPTRESKEFSNLGLASLVALETPHDLIDVEVRTLDDVLDDAAIERVDVIKIDVQGYEVEALKGMRGCLARHCPVVVFEYDAWAWGEANAQVSEASDILLAAGYSLFTLDFQADRDPQPLRAGTALPGLVELMAVHPASVGRTFP
jgi:FkbM family methyltransferase